MTPLRTPPFRPFALLLATVAASCSSSSSATPRDAALTDGASDATDAPVAETGPAPVDAHPDIVVDPQDCVPTTASSSESGVGGYCSPGGGQCAHAGPGGTATLCTADFGAPSHEWFCTVTCGSDTDCGAGGGACLAPPFAQQICVPAACASNLGDAGSLAVDGGDAASTTDASPTPDGSPDAPAVDGATDGGPDAREAGSNGDAAGDAGLDARDAGAPG